MSSTASPAPEPAGAEAAPFRPGFEPRLAGVRAECDGGAPIAGTHLAGRQDFAGQLTGHFRDFGPYPWRWFLMSDLVRKPQGYELAAVWCDGGNLTLIDAEPLAALLVPPSAS
jgi:hypothetical protein